MRRSLAALAASRPMECIDCTTCMHELTHSMWLLLHVAGLNNLVAVSDGKTLVTHKIERAQSRAIHTSGLAHALDTPLSVPGGASPKADPPSHSAGQPLAPHRHANDAAVNEGTPRSAADAKLFAAPTQRGDVLLKSCMDDAVAMENSRPQAKAEVCAWMRVNIRVHVRARRTAFN